MQKLFLFYVLFILATATNAQDRIITVEQDTIDCRILSVNDGRITFEQKTFNGYFIGKSLPMSQVATYLRLPRSSSSSFSRRPERPWLISLKSGGSWLPWLLDDTEAAETDYGKKLEKGFHLSTSGHYLFTSFFGIGMQYSYFHSSAKGEYPTMTSPYYPMYTMASANEQQYINYIGASAIFQHFLDKNKRFQLSGTVSGGMFFYRGESQMSTAFANVSGYSSYQSNSLITSQTLGATVGVSAEYYIRPFLSVGCSGEFMYGSLKKVDGELRTSGGNKTIIKDTELDDPLNISRIDYSLVLRLHF